MASYFLATSHADIQSLLAHFSSLSSQSSASETRCQTSVIFITAFTGYQKYFRVFLIRSAVKDALRFPICGI
jgi:hypothetical protein